MHGCLHQHLGWSYWPALCFPEEIKTSRGKEHLAMWEAVKPDYKINKASKLQVLLMQKSGIESEMLKERSLGPLCSWARLVREGGTAS